jgi:hypothetical protein
MLESRLGYDPVAECGTAQASLLPDLFNRISSAEFSSVALDVSRNFLTTVAQIQEAAPQRLAYATIEQSPLFEKKLAPDEQAKIRAGLLAPKGEVGNALPAVTFDKGVEIKTIPSSSGGNIGVLAANVPLKTNCDIAHCTPQWTAVTAKIKNQIYRGWVPASQLVPALALRFETADALYPSKSDLNALELKLKSSGTAQNVYQLTAVQTRESAAMAESRLVRLKSFLANLGVPESNIKLNINQVDRLDGSEFVEMKVEQAINPTNLPIAYQPAK